MRTRIINSSIPVLAFIDNQAISAGALISIACDSIYMRPGGNIGAATVVDQTGSLQFLINTSRLCVPPCGQQQNHTEKTP